MKKIPWGILGGICFILIFYLTIGIVVAFLILNAIAGQTSHTATLFDNAWQTVMFVFDIVFAIGFVGCTTMWFLKRRGGKNK